MIAKILLPLPVPMTYSYRVPEDMQRMAAFGKRVEVQFGKKKLYTGLIVEVLEEGSSEKLKSIRDILDDYPIITSDHYRFWQWMAEYYNCFLGEVMNAALPAPLKIDSETVLTLNKGFEYDEMELDDEAFLISEALTLQSELTWGDIESILQKSNVKKNVNELIEAGIVDVKEKAVRKNTHETVKTLMWSEEYQSNMSEAMEKVKRSEKQTRALLAFSAIRGQKKPPISRYEVMTKSDTDHATIRALLKKGILIETRVKKKFLGELKFRGQLPPLIGFQERAMDEMREIFEEKNVVLLEGVTGSGKTRIYLEWIRKMKKTGKQILLMIPEIALTTQIIQRLESLFESDVIVYHSRISEKSRMEAYHSVRSGATLVIGTRSSLLLPFQNLGLIIVDEEHDKSYKQHQPAPRYHGRDSAVYLAHLMNCRVILGSATPSMESQLNVKENKYGYVRMDKRFGHLALPEVELIDMRQVTMTPEESEIKFSPYLLQSMHQTLDAGRQIMVFQNRRGFAPVFLCNHCGHIVQCESCDVSMTYHKYSHKLQCHYCRREKSVPKECPSCHYWEMEMYGYGTEKLEEILNEFFPDINIDRLDYDTASGRKRLERILTRFANNDTQILVGTQMISKGLDFENVGLVVVPHADQLFAFPDFRSSEYALQMLKQVSGRAGRKKERGWVLIQTYNPEHPVFEALLSGKDELFYREEIQERKAFLYPPFYRLVKITFRNKNRTRNNQIAQEFYRYFVRHFQDRISVPVPPVISYINHFHLLDVFIKLEKNSREGAFFRKHMNRFLEEVRGRPGHSNFRIIVDVDPV